MTAAGVASAHQLDIDTQAAHAVLDALQNSRLTQAEALAVAHIPANLKVIEKVAGFGTGATEDVFVSELVAVAHGDHPSNERFFFARTKQRAPLISATLAQFERDRDTHVRWILDRIRQFSPPGASLRLKGFVVAGGNSTGFTFGGAEFYLRINDFVDAADYLKAMMAHELFHAVQGAALTAAHKQRDFSIAGFKRLASNAERDAYAVRGILTQLLDEGLATYVGDPLLTTAEARVAANERERIRAAAMVPRRLPTLLDMTLRSVVGPDALDPEDVYGVGFYNDQPLYYLGYLMAKAIAEKQGNARLGELALGDGCGFAREYLGLSKHDASLVPLGAPSRMLTEKACVNE